MSLTMTLKASTFIGTGYALNCLCATDKYLKDQGVAATEQTKYMVRGIAGGVAGIVTATYFAAFGGSDEMKRAVGLANITAFSIWMMSSVHQVVNVASGAVGPKIDLGICTAMLSAFVGSFVM